MEFLKTCTTNAQAIGDFEAIAYQAISVTRTANTTTTSTTSPQSSKQPPPSSSPSEDTRAVEAELRHALHLVAHDAARPWLWLFKPTTVDKLGQASPQLPELGGYRLQRPFSPSNRPRTHLTVTLTLSRRAHGRYQSHRSSPSAHAPRRSAPSRYLESPTLNKRASKRLTKRQ